MSLESTDLSDIMSKDVKIETQNQNIIAVSMVMSENDVGSVIIVDNDENRYTVGIVTERDIFRILSLFKPDLIQTHIKELISHPVFPLSEHATIADSLTLTQEKNTTCSNCR